MQMGSPVLKEPVLEIHLLMLWDLKAATPRSWEGKGVGSPTIPCLR